MILRATPTQASAARVVRRAALRLGYHYVALCEHCRDAVILECATWGPYGWVHRRTGSDGCSPSMLRPDK